MKNINRIVTIGGVVVGISLVGLLGLHMKKYVSEEKVKQKKRQEALQVLEQSVEFYKKGKYDDASKYIQKFNYKTRKVIRETKEYTLEQGWTVWREKMEFYSKMATEISLAQYRPKQLIIEDNYSKEKNKMLIRNFSGLLYVNNNVIVRDRLRYDRKDYTRFCAYIYDIPYLVTPERTKEWGETLKVYANELDIKEKELLKAVCGSIHLELYLNQIASNGLLEQDKQQRKKKVNAYIDGALSIYHTDQKEITKHYEKNIHKLLANVHLSNMLTCIDQIPFKGITTVDKTEWLMKIGKEQAKIKISLEENKAKLYKQYLDKKNRNIFEKYNKLEEYESWSNE